MRKQPLVFSESYQNYTVSARALSVDLHRLLSGDMQEAFVAQIIITRHMHFQISYHPWLKEPFCNSLPTIIHFDQSLCLWSFFQGQMKSEPEGKQNTMLITECKI